MVVEQPPKGLGTINDMWFSWIIDVGFPGPDRGEGGKYLLVPPGYNGPLPDGGFYVARSRTSRALYAARAFLTDNDPKPTVELIKKTIRIYPYTPGGVGTSIATALEGKVRLGRNLPVPETRFVEASGKSFNTNQAHADAARRHRPAGRARRPVRVTRSITVFRSAEDAAGRGGSGGRRSACGAGAGGCPVKVGLPHQP